jgi:hypothetical protein
MIRDYRITGAAAESLTFLGATRKMNVLRVLVDASSGEIATEAAGGLIVLCAAGRKVQAQNSNSTRPDAYGPG